MAAEKKTKLRLEIAHVLFIDIVGYSKLSIDEQRRTIERLNEIVQRTEEFEKAESAKRLVKIPTGDGMALVFYDSPESPVECAIEVSRKLSVPDAPRVRMGIHSGPVSGVVDVTGRGNVAGDGINTAQRVMSCGDAGHILLSRRVAQDLSQFKHWRPHLHDLGETEVKHGARVGLVNLFTGEIGNSDRPSKLEYAPAATAQTAQETPWERKRLPWLWLTLGAVVMLALVGVILFLRGRTGTKLAFLSANIPEKSIAVMPFENRSRDADNAYFADGIQDEILTRLSNIAELKVISRTSTQHYKSAPENLSEIGKQLRVAHIVEGSVQKSGDTVRVNVQLIKAANDSHLWAETFDRKLTDIFAVETEVAKAIADQLRAKLSGQEQQILAARPTENPEAYDAYLRGIAYNLRPNLTQRNALAAQENLRKAVGLDSKFAVAWALLARIDALMHSTFQLPTCEEAREAADTALALQPTLGETLMAKGYYYYGCLRDYESAKTYFERARQVLPNNSQVPEALALVSRRQAEWDASLKYFNQAEELDPRNTRLLTQYALTYVIPRRLDEAARKLDQILAIVPQDVDTLAVKACVLISKGDVRGASALLSSVHPTSDQVLPLEVQAYAAILQRKTQPIVSQLREALGHANPARRQENAELRFWLGWAESAGGDAAAAATWQQTRSQLEALLKEQPENATVIADLALTCIGLGDTSCANSVIDRALNLDFVKRDALIGPLFEELRARAAAKEGAAERAIPLLAELLSKPYGAVSYWDWRLTPATLRLDPMFDPIRNDPRFQKLISSAPK